MIEKVFTLISEVEDHAAYQVACFWLHSADLILERGDVPGKLSKCSLQLSRDELDRDIYRPFNRKGKADIAKIAGKAMAYAKAKLLVGQFPRVRQHFELQGDHDSKKLAGHLLERCGEIIP